MAKKIRPLISELKKEDIMEIGGALIGKMRLSTVAGR
jgi:hypothetical protein